ncbi:hypothetical protein GLX30_30325 [Streptomyces sp. Tu 2975]|uniref:hypothetical protein n=1 Tax=Streptomyces sp. Tu 2975 TaxID=2676871 RepID=UPI001358609C|nr:hypothetical protein [Streptomyces sp. Tu 2975]QIP87611.1 hypothetical protein GLX30_30325 [Streptomyces sp. Tu 2975]
MTAETPAKAEQPETPGPKFAKCPISTTPATVDLCQADYQAGAEDRRLFDQRAKRQHGR